MGLGRDVGGHRLGSRQRDVQRHHPAAEAPREPAREPLPEPRRAHPQGSARQERQAGQAAGGEGRRRSRRV